MSETILPNPSQAVVTEAAPAFIPRQRTLQIGALFATAASVMYFGGLFGIYAATRNTFLKTQELLAEAGERTTTWIPGGVRVELTAPTVMTWTLLISLVTMAWAIQAFKTDDRRHGLLAIAVTAMFGVAVINQVVFQWNQLGLVIDKTGGSPAAPLIYAITASHVIMIAIALLWLLIVAFRAAISNSVREHLDSVSSVAIYWTAMVAMYFIIWILIFITK